MGTEKVISHQIMACRDKQLKNSQSWCTPLIQKLFFALKKDKSIDESLSELSLRLKAEFETKFEKTRVEPTGIITMISDEPKVIS